MISNESIQVTVNSYSTIPDALGQVKKTITSTRTIMMYIAVYSQEDVHSPRYVEADYIGLTEDKAITVNNTISFSNKTYNVLQVVPTSRYTRVLLQEWK